MCDRIRNQMPSWRILISINVVLHLLTALPVVAQTAEERGRTIAQEAYRRDSGFQDMTAQLTMVIHRANGRERTWEMRTKVLEVPGDGSKTVIVFDSPLDLRGTALLTVDHRTGSDQWLYLPAFRRVKRIASASQTDSFMGSEFSYEDIRSQMFENYRYRLVSEEPLDGRDAFIVERVPLNAASGYSRQIVWFDTHTYRTLRVDYYDRSEQLVKTLTISGYRLYLGRFWRPDTMLMVNHQTDANSTLRWRDYAFETGLTDRDFDRRSLTRAT